MNWIKKIVLDLTEKHKTNDPFELASNKKIQVITWNLHEEIKGFYKYDRRNQYIFLNNNLDETSQKFVCAHELGHSQLHPRTNTPFLRKSTLLSTDKIEREANEFAVELLFLDNFLIECYEMNLTIYEACEMYGIPRELAKLKK